MMTLLGFFMAGHNRFAAVPAARSLLAEPVLGATVLGGRAGHHTRRPTRWPHDGPHNRRLAWVAQTVQAAGSYHNPNAATASSVTFSPDENTLASGSADGTAGWCCDPETGADQELRVKVAKPLDFEVRCNVYAWAS
jgi:hypothetical protein